jgi:hypothetical protein
MNIGEILIWESTNALLLIQQVSRSGAASIFRELLPLTIRTPPAVSTPTAFNTCSRSSGDL